MYQVYYSLVLSDQGSGGPDEGRPGRQGEPRGQKGPAGGGVEGELQTYQWTESSKETRLSLNLLRQFILVNHFAALQTAPMYLIIWFKVFSHQLYYAKSNA